MTKKIILLLVEGPTDEDALALVFSNLVNDHDIEFIVDTSKLTDRYYHVIMTCRINEETVKKQMGFVVTV